MSRVVVKKHVHQGSNEVCFFIKLKIRRLIIYIMLIDSIPVFIQLKNHVLREFDWPGAVKNLRMRPGGFSVSSEVTSLNVNISHGEIHVESFVFAFSLEKILRVNDLATEDDCLEAILSSKPFALFCECTHGVATQVLNASRVATQVLNAPRITYRS